MNHSIILFISILSLSVARAQTPLTKPQAGYTYRVETGTAGKVVYVSGQRPFDVDGNLVGAGNLTVQTRQVFENLKTALGKVGMTLDNVTQVTYHLKGVTGLVDDQAKQQVSSVSTTYFLQGTPKIAATKSIPKIVRDDVLLEVEVIAVK